MKTNRRKFSSKFKTKVVLEALKEQYGTPIHRTDRLIRNL